MRGELEGNFKTAELFRKAPELRYLPTAASERGMCGVFFQGTTQLFFVFGYDKPRIQYGDFIEIDNTLYDRDEYLYDVRVHIHGQSVLRRSFNAYPISRNQYSTAEVELIVELMNDLERVTAIGNEFGIPLTEYFNYTTTFDALVKQYYDKLSTSFSKRESDRMVNELLFHFKSCMMTSENPRPDDEGLTLEDYKNSAYCVDTDPRAIEKWFRRPEKWDEHLFSFTKDYADNSALSAMYVYKFVAQQLECLLLEFNIPHRYTDIGKVSPKLARHLSATETGAREDDMSGQLIVVYPAIYSMFMQYLMRCAYIDFHFTQEEKDEGYRIFKTGQFYGFSIPLVHQVLHFLRGRGIKVYCHELLQLKVLSGSLDGYCFVPLKQKPLVDAALMDYAAMQAYTHSQGSFKFYAASELRIPKWEGGHQISICEYGCETGSALGDGIALTDYFNLHLDHVPDKVLKEHGLLADPPIINGTATKCPCRYDETGKPEIGTYSWKMV